MELKEFIEESLMQIVEGVQSAQEKAAEKHAYISPSGIRTDDPRNYIKIGNVVAPLNQVEFEIVLTNSDDKEHKGGLGVLLGGVGLGGQAKTDVKSGSITNVKFSVPVVFSRIQVALDDLL